MDASAATRPGEAARTRAGPWRGSSVGRRLVAFLALLAGQSTGDALLEIRWRRSPGMGQA